MVGATKVALPHHMPIRAASVMMPTIIKGHANADANGQRSRVDTKDRELETIDAPYSAAACCLFLGGFCYPSSKNFGRIAHCIWFCFPWVLKGPLPSLLKYERASPLPCVNQWATKVGERVKRRARWDPQLRRHRVLRLAKERSKPPYQGSANCWSDRPRGARRAT